MGVVVNDGGRLDGVAEEGLASQLCGIHARGRKTTRSSSDQCSRVSRQSFYRVDRWTRLPLGYWSGRMVDLVVDAGKDASCDSEGRGGVANVAGK